MNYKKVEVIHRVDDFLITVSFCAIILLNKNMKGTEYGRRIY